MIIVVVGMHRSGTSLTASILGKNGLYLGQLGQLDVHYENLDVVDLNNELMSYFGLSWRKVSKPIVLKKIPIKFYKAAEHIIGKFDGPNWGFKDPRTTVLYPFWKQILPEHKVVFCVRHPTEVAMSLEKRGHPPGDWRKLWLQYNEQGLKHTAKADRHFVFYEDYFKDQKRNVKKLLSFCKLKYSKLDVVLGDLRHNIVKQEEMDSAEGLYYSLYHQFSFLGRSV